MKIGVFDSGIGGLSVVQAIEQALPNDEVLFVNDRENVPYGTKTPDTIYRLILPIFQNLVDSQCDAIVVACNTVSTTLISRLRSAFDIPFVALEPMVKPAAAQTKTGVIAVCATPTTLASERYHWLKETYGYSCTIIEPDCSDWALLIERNTINDQHIRSVIEPVLLQDADVIVLGCTHYHWISTQIEQIVAGRASILQPEQAVVNQLKRVLGLIA